MACGSWSRQFADLLDVIRHKNVAERCTHVVISLGDGAFAVAAASRTAAATTATMVGRRRNLSRRHCLAAHKVVFTDDTEQPGFATLGQMMGPLAPVPALAWIIGAGDWSTMGSPIPAALTRDDWFLTR